MLHSTSAVYRSKITSLLLFDILLFIWHSISLGFFYNSITLRDHVEVTISICPMLISTGLRKAYNIVDIICVTYSQVYYAAFVVIRHILLDSDHITRQFRSLFNSTLLFDILFLCRAYHLELISYTCHAKYCSISLQIHF